MDIVQAITEQGVTLGFCVIFFMLYTKQNEKSLNQYKEDLKLERQENQEREKTFFDVIKSFSKDMRNTALILEQLLTRVERIESKLDVEEEKENGEV